MDCLIIDTSSIIFGLSNRVDIFNVVKAQHLNCRVLLSSGIVDELRRMGSGRGKNAKFGRVAITLLNRYDNIKIVKNKSYVDSWILEAAKASGCSVCTNDIKLKKALKSEGITAYSISRNGSLR